MNTAPAQVPTSMPFKARCAPLRVFVAEDSEILRNRVVGLVEEIQGVAVTGESGTADGATAGILAGLPDVVILDLQLAEGSGLDVLKAVRSQAPQIDFIVLTNHSGPQYRRLCMARGARHFLDKSHDFSNLGPILADLVSGRCNTPPAA